MMKSLLVLTLLVAAASAHLCLLSPRQRGTMEDLNTAGENKFNMRFYTYTCMSIDHAWPTTLRACVAPAQRRSFRQLHLGSCKLSTSTILILSAYRPASARGVRKIAFN